MLTPTLYRDRKNFRLLTMVGVKDARCSASGVISGHFKTKLIEFAGDEDRQLVETLVNWPDDSKSIVRFTLQYGPLKVAAKEGAPFSFKVEEFKHVQAYFRELWTKPQGLTELGVPGGTLRLLAGAVTFTVSDLFRYLEFDLLMNSPDRVRVCKRVGCLHPYFIAAHLKKQFCGPECAEEGQRNAKRDWWERSGQEWRQNQRQKEVKGGSNKTR